MVATLLLIVSWVASRDALHKLMDKALVIQNKSHNYQFVKLVCIRQHSAVFLSCLDNFATF